MQTRYQSSNAHVHNLKKLWICANEIKFDCITTMFCSRESAKITMSKISHDSTATKNSNVRRTMFLWFVDVKNDDEILNNEKSKIWFELIATHIYLIASLLSSSKLRNRYDVISYRFSIVIHLQLSSSMNNVFVCRTIWNDSNVFAQINLLLNDNRVKTKYVIKKNRLLALRAFKNAFECVKKIEKIYYDENDYFAKIITKTCISWVECNIDVKSMFVKMSVIDITIATSPTWQNRVARFCHIDETLFMLLIIKKKNEFRCCFYNET